MKICKDPTLLWGGEELQGPSSFKKGRYEGSWSLANIPSMLVQAGGKRSAEHGGDSDAANADPIWDHAVLGEGLNLDLDENKVEAESHRTRVQYLLALVVEVASRMTHKDVCVMFGRDLYGIQGILEAWQHKLRGHWIYVEGVSREVVHDKSVKETICSKVRPFMKNKKARVFGVDTGWNGSIPEAALDEFYSRLEIVLLSGNRKERRAFPVRDKDGTESAIREVALKIEHHPKPFMRAVEVTNGYPVLRLARRKDIEKAAVYYAACKYAAEQLLPDLPCILSSFGSAEEVLPLLGEDD
jgi:hypothetical protein